MELGFPANDILVVNNNTDYITGLPYTTRGQICRDAVTHASGKYFMLADDDDLYLPWHMEQAVDKLIEVGTDAWKPHQSFFMTPGRVELATNTMEASVIVKMHRIREIGFGMGLTGREGLSWYIALREEAQLSEQCTHHVPSYCFNWSDPPELAGHKQSGNIDNPRNFENHKQQSTDYAKEPLCPLPNLDAVYRPLYEYISRHREAFPSELLTKYVYKSDINTN